MPFVYDSALPRPISQQDEFDCVSGFDCDIDSIKKMLTEIANTYLQIAFRIYEINRYKSYKPKYNNLVEACQFELGFKKSTTYNMLNIVKEFGEPDSSGYITYKSLFGVSKFSYSQLCEMLSLSERQRSLVSPNMTIREIRQLKKCSIEVLDVPPDLEPLDSSEFVDVSDNEVIVSDGFQTSGKSECFNKKRSSFSFHCSSCNIILSDLEDIKLGDSSDSLKSKYGYSFKFCPECGCRVLNYVPFSYDYHDD